MKEYKALKDPNMRRINFLCFKILFEYRVINPITAALAIR